MRTSGRARIGLLAAGMAALLFAAGSIAQERAGSIEAARQPAPMTARASIDAPWTAVAASGRVESNFGAPCVAPWRRVTRGGTVPSRSHVRTFARSRATLTRGGDILLVSANSEVLLPALTDPSTTTIHQSSGKALYQFEPRRDGQVQVVTPYLVAGVKGTVFSVIVDRDYASVHVVSGHVEVRSLFTGELVDLFPGDMALVEPREGSMSVQHDLPERAELSPTNTAPGVVESREQTGDLLRVASKDTLSWEAEETDLWNDLALSDNLDLDRSMRMDGTRTLLQEDRVITKTEENRQKTILGIPLSK